jgi:hypothetical protein
MVGCSSSYHMWVGVGFIILLSIYFLRRLHHICICLFVCVWVSSFCPSMHLAVRLCLGFIFLSINAFGCSSVSGFHLSVHQWQSPSIIMTMPFPLPSSTSYSARLSFPCSYVFTNHRGLDVKNIFLFHLYRRLLRRIY